MSAPEREREGLRARLLTLLADLAARALRPATHAEVLTLFLLLLGLGGAGLLVHGGDIGQIEESRRSATFQSCEQANERHRQAIPALQGFVTRNPPKAPLTAAEAEQQERAIVEFAGVIAPDYLAGSMKLPTETRERLGCERRVREVTRP